MIIVNQNKDVIINMNIIACIQTSKENIGNIEVVLFNKIDSHNGLTVGEYKTEERAKEVLKEIINKYLEYATVKNGIGEVKQVHTIPKIYEMPEE